MKGGVQRLQIDGSSTEVTDASSTWKTKVPFTVDHFQVYTIIAGNFEQAHIYLLKFTT